MMDFGGRRVRAKLVALLVVLVALWSYATYLTSRDGLDLLQVHALGESLGQPADLLILGLQSERRMTVDVLGDPTQPRTALAAQRKQTDEAATALRDFTHDGDPRLLSAGTVRDRAAALVRQLDGIGALRQDVDAARLDRDHAARAYNELIDGAFPVYGSQWGSRESALVGATRGLVALARARELLAREDTLVGGVLAASRVGATEQRRVVELIANQRFARAEAVAGLPAAARAEYQGLVAGPAFAGLAALEEQILRQDAAGWSTAITPSAWQAAVAPAQAGLRELVARGIRDSAARATPSAAAMVVRTVLVFGVGLVAILAAIFGSVAASRRHARRIGELNASAAALAEQELPDIARRLRRGEPVDPPPEPAPLPPGADPFDELGWAIEAARAATVRAVLTEAESHKGTWDLFLQLTRRNQTLLRDQLSLLDTMERRERDNEELADLFRVDHLATRMRRNVEKLITMAGATPARRWRRPVPLLDVVRGAVAEVIDYPRVLVAPHWRGALAGPVVPDVIHLLAELIENGLAFAPASTTVRVSGEPRDGGCAIVITDDGPGMSGPSLAAANELLRNPPLHRPPGAGHGLYAVGLIARRRGVEVELRAAQRGGTQAVVLLPAGRLVGMADGGPAAARATATAEYSHLSGGVSAEDPSAPPRDTPGGLPVRARQPAPGAPDSTPLPTRTTRQSREPLAPPEPGGGGALPVRVPTGSPGTDGSETMEMPIARSADDQPDPNRPGARSSTVGPGPSIHPTRVGGGFTGSERTTSGSPNGHDR